MVLLDLSGHPVRATGMRLVQMFPLHVPDQSNLLHSEQTEVNGSKRSDSSRFCSTTLDYCDLVSGGLNNCVRSWSRMLQLWVSSC